MRLRILRIGALFIADDNTPLFLILLGYIT